MNSPMAKDSKILLDELRRLHALNQELLSALNAMLIEMSMDEDEWNAPAFDQARAAVAKAKEQQ